MNALRLNSEQRTEGSSLGNLLLGDDPVEASTLTDATRRRVTDGITHATLLYADGAPADRVDAAEARLRALDLRTVHVRKVE